MSEQIKSKFLGDFGEYLLTWHLRSKFGINVGLVKGEGIDLLCRDEEGALFPKGELIAISVKTRERRKDKVRDTVDANWDKIERASDRWKAKPYFAFIRITPEEGDITFFLLPVPKARGYGIEFSVAKAEKEPSNVRFKMQFEGYPRLKDWRKPTP